MPLVAAYSMLRTVSESVPGGRFCAMKRKISFIFIDSAHGESTSAMANSCCAVSTRTMTLFCSGCGSTSTSATDFCTWSSDGEQHLLGIDARRIDVRVVDAHQRVVEDAQRRQIIGTLVVLLSRAQRLAGADVDVAVRSGATDRDAQRQHQSDENEERLEVATHERLRAGCVLE